MSKYSVRVGNEFEIEECNCDHSRRNRVAIDIKVNEGKSEKEPRRPHMITAGLILVGMVLAVSASSALAYGLATGDFGPLKAFPDLIQQLFAAAISMMTKK